MMNNIDNNNFNELISGVEDCLKDSPFSDTDYFLDLLSQVDFLLIIRDIYDNNFCLSDGIVEKIISCGYRVCDVQAIISYAESGILDCSIIPIVNHKPLIKLEIEKEVEEKEDKQDTKIHEDKYFKYFFSCSEVVGVQADFYIKVSSNLLNVNKLVFDLLSLMKAQYIMVSDNEIRIQLDLFDDDNVSLIDGMCKFIPIEESKADTYCIIYGEEKQLEFIFGFLSSIEYQIADRIYVENKFIELQRSINRLPKEMLNVKLERLIEDKDALDFFKRNEKIFIYNILEDIPLGINSKYIDDLANGINESDTRSVSQAIIDTFKILKPSEEDVIRRRYFGESIATLESIGIAHNVTRERVRQIEAKSKEKIAHQKIGKKNRITDIIKLYSEFGSFFTDNDLIALNLPKGFGLFLDSFMGEVLWDTEFSVGFYNQKLSIQIKEELESLPDEFLLSELEGYSKDIANVICESVTWQEISFLVKRRYKEVGDFLIRGRLTLRVVLAYLITKYFPAGLDVYDEDNIKFLREKAKEHFDGFELAENDRAITARIQSFCVPIARGVWKWASSESLLDEQLKDDIITYIENYNSPVVPIHAVYIAFEKRLNAAEINNKYHLQGEIKKIISKNYAINRDYIFKESSTSFYTVLESFVKESKTLVTKKDIIKNFPGTTDITIQQACATTKIVNMNGYYVHLDNLAISEYERTQLKDSIDSCLDEKSIFHAKNIYRQIRDINSGLFNRIGIEHYLQFYYLIKELFPNDYEYNRPFMAHLGVNVISGEAQVLEIISAKPETDVSDIHSYAREIGTMIDRTIEFVDRNNDVFIFKNRHFIVMLDVAGVYDDDFDDIDNVLDGFIGKQKYRSLLDFLDYWKLPKLNCAWNEWVLYSIINKYSKKYKGIVSSNYLSEAVPCVARQEVGLDEVDFSEIVKISIFDDDNTDLEDILDFDDLE